MLGTEATEQVAALGGQQVVAAETQPTAEATAEHIGVRAAVKVQMAARREGAVRESENEYKGAVREGGVWLLHRPVALCEY